VKAALVPLIWLPGAGEINVAGAGVPDSVKV
jgi:hypothetical protein